MVEVHTEYDGSKIYKNKEEIKIAQIRNLKAIYFYYVDSKVHDTSYLGLKVNYGNFQVLQYDYRSPYYDLFLHKVLECYLKEGKTAKLVGNETSIILDEIQKRREEHKKKVYFSYNVFSEQMLKDITIKDLLLELAKKILTLYGDKYFDDVQIDTVKGRRGKYYICYHSQSLSQMISVLITSNHLNHFHFQLDVNHQFYDEKLQHAHKKNNLKNIYDHWNGKMQITEEQIFIELFSNRMGVQVNWFYSPEKNYNENTLIRDGEILKLQQGNNDLILDIIDALNAFCHLLGIDPSFNVIPISWFQYLLYQTKSVDEHIEIKEYLHITCAREERVATIDRKTIFGKKDENNHFLPISSIREQIAINYFYYHSDDYLFLEHHYLDSDYTIGEYQKRQLRNYSYELAKIDLKYHALVYIQHPFVIYEQKELDNLQEIYEISKLLTRKKEEVDEKVLSKALSFKGK